MRNNIVGILCLLLNLTLLSSDKFVKSSRVFVKWGKNKQTIHFNGKDYALCKRCNVYFSKKTLAGHINGQHCQEFNLNIIVANKNSENNLIANPSMETRLLSFIAESKIDSQDTHDAIYDQPTHSFIQSLENLKIDDLPEDFFNEMMQ